MVYLIHFHSPYKHAKHYLGFVQSAEGLEARITRHKKGDGAKLTGVVAKAGIDFHVSRVWPNGSRDFERSLKKRKASPRLCPECNPKAMNRAVKGIYSYVVKREEIVSVGTDVTGRVDNSGENSG